MNRLFLSSMLSALCFVEHARAEQPANASQPPTEAQSDSDAPAPTVYVVMHSLLSDEQREALQESLLWQLQSLNLHAEFTSVTWARPTHKEGSLATLWISVDGSDWKLFVFDGKSSYVRRIERADQDAAVVEAVTVIAQRSLAAIVQGEPPQLERVQPDTAAKPPPRKNKKELIPSPFLQLTAGYQVSSFAPQVPPVSAAVARLQLQLYRSLAVRASYTYFGTVSVSNARGVLALSRHGAGIQFGYWRKIGRFSFGGYAGITAEHWQRNARATQEDVIATGDTTHIIGVPNGSFQVVWFAERSIAPYMAVGAAVPLGAPQFSVSSEQRQVLLSPRPFRGIAELGISVQFY